MNSGPDPLRVSHYRAGRGARILFNAARVTSGVIFLRCPFVVLICFPLQTGDRKPLKKSSAPRFVVIVVSW